MTSRVRIFSADKLSTEAREKKWDRVKVVCTQPFNSVLDPHSSRSMRKGRLVAQADPLGRRLPQRCLSRAAAPYVACDPVIGFGFTVRTVFALDNAVSAN